MSDRLLLIVAFGSVLGCGLVAGVFFAFSTFVMKALARVSPPQGIAAMQSINIAVINPWFLTVFVGTAVACFILAIASLITWQNPGSGWLLAGGLFYVVSSFLVTIAFNIPRNAALAAVDPASPDGARLWANFLVTWTKWNHVRAAGALAATAALIMALQSARVVGVR